jgi:hypothetical protein
MSELPDETHEDQDAGPASQPAGAAAEQSPAEDQDAGPASEPNGGADDAADAAE